MAVATCQTWEQQQVQCLSDGHPDVVEEHIMTDVMSLVAYSDGYAMEASLLIAETLQTVRLTDGLHAYLLSVAECAWQAYIRTDVITTRIWQ